MSESYEVIEAWIQRAITSLATQEKPNISTTSKEFHVPAQQPWAQWNGCFSKITRPAAGKKLTVDQEMAVYRYLDRLDKVGTAARCPMLVHCANFILSQSHTNSVNPSLTVGHNWPKCFLDAHAEYYIRKQKLLGVKQQNSHKPITIQCWFENYLNIVQSKGISSSNIYNVDKTEFQIGIRRSQWIIIGDKTYQAYLASSSNRETVTCVKTISDNGSVLLLMIIFLGSLLMEHWFSSDIQDEALFAVSDTGYTNNELTLEWLTHFEKYSKQC